MTPLAVAQDDALRTTPRRIFNAFRLVIAGLFVVAGEELVLGGEHPDLYFSLAIAYLAFAFVTGFPWLARRLGGQRLILLQSVVDIVMLTAVMAVSGGHSSGVGALMMVYVAAAGVLSEGRTPLFVAALATFGVLGENLWRHLMLSFAGDSWRVGVLCIGFFAVALAARLLAARASTQESLAEERGEALDRQQAINERIIEDMPDGVLLFGADGHLRQLNPSAAALLGGDVRVGERVPEIEPLVEACRLGVLTQGAAALRLGEGRKLMRCRAVLANPADGGESDVVVYLTDFEDVQKQIQQHKLAALGRLTASMAHEIRNPLTAVSQAAELLGEEKRAEVQARLARIIRDNAGRIERLVREVLALGRRDEVVREALPLVPALSGIVEEVSLAGGAERAVYALKVPANATLWIDRAHLHQIVLNLLGNARRYCSGRPGSVRIEVVEPAVGRVALHIRDDGPGIDEARRANVFDPFFTTDPSGTGLGLYIARELADANGASLELAPDDTGAHFILSGRSRP